MIQIRYAPVFLQQLGVLPPELQAEAIEKVELFRQRVHHKQLKVHKLKGRLGGRYSFSVNYQTRIIFQWAGGNQAVFLAIGDHDVYKL